MIPKKPCPVLNPGWEPVFGKDHPQTKSQTMIAVQRDGLSDVSTLGKSSECANGDDPELPFNDGVQTSALSSLLGRLQSPELKPGQLDRRFDLRSGKSAGRELIGLDGTCRGRGGMAFAQL